MQNIYFDLTREFNAEGVIVALGSGQAVVFHRIAIMSKDGDWIVRESDASCPRILSVLESRGAQYRAGAPLDLDWLRGGWSSHLEFSDDQGRRIRCDFFSRPPRIAPSSLQALFDDREMSSPLVVIGVEPLILMKQTQRAKDYPVIGELARLLAPERELQLTTDPDRILELAGIVEPPVERPAAVAARGGDRDRVVVELAREVDGLQRADRARLDRYRIAAVPYLRALQASRPSLEGVPLREAHQHVLELARRHLPTHPEEDSADGDAQRR